MLLVSRVSRLGAARRAPVRGAPSLGLAAPPCGTLREGALADAREARSTAVSASGGRFAKKSPTVHQPRDPCDPQVARGHRERTCATRSGAANRNPRVREPIGPTPPGPEVEALVSAPCGPNSDHGLEAGNDLLNVIARAYHWNYTAPRPPGS